MGRMILHRTQRCALAGLALLLASHARAQSEAGARLHGSLANKIALDTGWDSLIEDESFDHARASLELSGDFWGLQGKAAARADWYLGARGGDSVRSSSFDPMEIYLLWRREVASVRIGNQVVRWGRTDEVSPLNIINPEDVREGALPSRSSRKIAVPMVNVELETDTVFGQALLLPFFRPARFDVTGSDWALFSHAERAGDVKVLEPNEDWSLQPEFGGRAGVSIGQFDLAVDYFRTRDDAPSIGTIAITDPFDPANTRPSRLDLARAVIDADATVPLAFHPSSIAGVDFETVWGSFGFRGDFAYTDRRQFLDTALVAFERSVTDWVVGADYNGPNELYMNLQFSQSLILDYLPTTLFTDELTSGVSGTVRKAFANRTLDAAVRFFYEVSNDSYYVNPYLEMKYWKNVTIGVGADLLDGRETSALGFYKDNSQMYLSTEVLF